MIHQGDRLLGIPPCAVSVPFQDPRLYIQEAVLDRRAFVSLAKACGLDVSENLLDWYVANGYFAPVIEFVVEDEPEAPRVLGFSRWQLLALHRLEEVRVGQSRVWSGVPVEKQDARSWIDALRRVNFGPFMRSFTTWLELVILVQNKYVPAARGHRNWSIEHRSDIDRGEHDAYLNGPYAERIADGAPLHEVGLAMDEALELRRHIGVLIWSLDPLKRWYRLTRFVSAESRELLEGTPRLAQELYMADRILQEYFGELTGAPQPDTEDLRGSAKDEWATRLYGRPKDYRDPSFLEVILTQFGLHPAPGAVVFVEGETELDLFPQIGALFGYSFEHLGVELELLGGVNEAPHTTKLVEYLARPRTSGKGKLLRRPLTTPYVVVDNEGIIQRGRYIAMMKKKGLEAYLHVWPRDLERDNFNARELATAISATFGTRVDESDLQLWVASRVSLNAWFGGRLGRRINKREMVPALLQIIIADLDRRDFTRPVVALVWRIVQYAVHGAPVPDPRRDGLEILGR